MQGGPQAKSPAICERTIPRHSGGGRCDNWRVRRLAALLVATAAGTIATGCGGTSSYTLDATRECLRDTSGVRVRRPPPSDFVASTALGGAVNVKFPDNQVTIAFGEDEAEAERLAMAYRRFRGENVGIESALQEQKNVVMVWGVTPAPEQRGTVEGCLKT
jgi:hypothetical protein